MLTLNVAGALAALLAVFLVPIRGSAAGPPIAVLGLSTATWCAGAAWSIAQPSSTAAPNALILASASVSAAAAFVAARRLVEGRWPVPPALMVLFVVEPIAIALVRVGSYSDATSAQFRTTVPFTLHAIYSFALMVGLIWTLNARQRDSERRVRTFVLVTQVIVITIIALEVSANESAQFVVLLAVLLATRIARHPQDWTTSAARGDRLLDSIGVFLFVFNQRGELEDWNGNASQLIELMLRRRPDRTMTDQQILGRSVPFRDGQPIPLELHGGRIMTTAQVHEVDSQLRVTHRTWVVMLRPVTSSVDKESFPQISRSLAGYDPVTQTLGRRATLDLLRDIAERNTAVVRVDVTPTNPQTRDDEVMFVVARRLESTYPDIVWGRLATWTLVAEFNLQQADATAYAIERELETSAGLSATVTTYVCPVLPDEEADAFVHRVDNLQNGHGGIAKR